MEVSKKITNLQSLTDKNFSVMKRQPLFCTISSIMIPFFAVCFSAAVAPEEHVIPGLPYNRIPEPIESESETSAVSAPLTNGKHPFRFLQSVVPPSPKAELARYTEYPVSHSTDIPNISVPLYEIDFGGYRMPISISYYASGAGPYQIPTGSDARCSSGGGPRIRRG